MCSVLTAPDYHAQKLDCKVFGRCTSAPLKAHEAQKKTNIRENNNVGFDEYHLEGRYQVQLLR